MRLVVLAAFLVFVPIAVASAEPPGTAQTARSGGGRSVASMSAPVALSPTDGSVDASLPQVAVDARGNAFAVWQEERANGIFTRAAVKPAGAAWGATQTLARGGFTSLAVDARGDALVAGLTLAARQGVFAVYRPAGGDWGRAVLLGALGLTEGVGLSAAIDGERNALVAWVSATGRIEISSRKRGHWTSQSVGNGADPALAVNDNGDALVVWHTPATGDGRFLVSWNASHGGWQRPQPMPFPSGTLIRPESPQVILDDQGNATVFWTNWDAAVFSSSATRGDSFGAPQNLRVGYDGLQAQASVAPDGSVALAAVGNRGSGPLQLRIRTSATAGWRAPVVLDQAALQSAIALDPARRLLVAWVEYDDTGGGSGQLLLKDATGTSVGHVSTASTLATIGGDCWMHRCLHGGDPAVAIGPRGQAIIAWVAKADPYHGTGIVMVTTIRVAV